MKYFIFCCMIFICISCTDPQGATRILESQGYSNIEITGYSWYGCDGKSDYYSTGFNATAPNGSNVSGTVCKGAFGIKGSTIRLR